MAQVGHGTVCLVALDASGASAGAVGRAFTMARASALVNAQC
jgi:hypothetical protein